PSCNCFGQLHSRPIGWNTFASNSVLAALAYGLTSAFETPNLAIRLSVNASKEALQRAPSSGRFSIGGAAGAICPQKSMVHSVRDLGRSAWGLQKEETHNSRPTHLH